MMRQWIYFNHDSNGHNEMHLREVQIPELKSASDVLVRIHAVSLNYRDVTFLAISFLRAVDDQARNIYLFL